jgi:hypothetical protein
MSLGPNHQMRGDDASHQDPALDGITCDIPFGINEDQRLGSDIADTGRYEQTYAGWICAWTYCVI